MKPTLTRRKLLQVIAGGVGVALLEGCSDSGDAITPATQDWPIRPDFTSAGAEDWGEGWICHGVANLRRGNGLGALEAGSDIFPNDPRPLVFALDSRALDARIRVEIVAAGKCVGAVLRRLSPRDYYAALYESDLLRLRIVRRSGFELVALSSVPVLPTAIPGLLPGSTAILEFSVSGISPSQLNARLIGADGLTYETSASDDTEILQAAGDAGVLTAAETLLPDSNPVLPALGNLHLLPYSVQEGQAVIESPVGAALIELMRQRSTAQFSDIAVESAEIPRPTPASVVAATTGLPLNGGATLQVASDLPAEILIDVARTPDFADAQVIRAGHTGAFDALAHDVTGLNAGVTYWRPRLRRRGLETVGPTRQFRVLPSAGSPERITLAYGACASQFNANFDHIAARVPDVFIWQGDLNYPDTHGPFAQTMAGYAGIWRHFLDNPRLTPILERSCFIAGRDDHDYGLQDANAANLPPWGLAPWDALMSPRSFQRFSAGLVDVWLLDQRMFKSEPGLPDTTDKSLLGTSQRQWLFEGLANSSAPFKIICSPNTLAPAPGANARDGSWASGFTAERDLLLQHIRENVSGQAIFLSGDTHFTMVWDQDGFFEQRACPLDIPLPNDQNISNPLLELTYPSLPGVAYWSRNSHFSQISVEGQGSSAVMTVELVRQDGNVVHSRRFETNQP